MEKEMRILGSSTILQILRSQIIKDSTVLSLVAERVYTTHRVSPDGQDFPYVVLDFKPAGQARPGFYISGTLEVWCFANTAAEDCRVIDDAITGVIHIESLTLSDVYNLPDNPDARVVCTKQVPAAAGWDEGMRCHATSSVFYLQAIG